MEQFFIVYLTVVLIVLMIIILIIILNEEKNIRIVFPLITLFTKLFTAFENFFWSFISILKRLKELATYVFPFNSDNSLFMFSYSVLLSINEIQNFPWFSSINHWPNWSTSLHLANLFLIICFWSLAGNFWPASRTMLVFPKQKSYVPCIRSINYLVFHFDRVFFLIIK